MEKTINRQRDYTSLKEELLLDVRQEISLYIKLIWW